jgi:hypothetical protein
VYSAGYTKFPELFRMLHLVVVMLYVLYMKCYIHIVSIPSRCILYTCTLIFLC